VPYEEGIGGGVSVRECFHVRDECLERRVQEIIV
jgi:hypothetical protein